MPLDPPPDPLTTLHPPPEPDPQSEPFVSRGGRKLAAALVGFNLSVAGRSCVDLGCSVGGFTDCLLQRGASRVYAVDTAYGTLAWKLRQDPRVIVRERTNALHATPQSLGLIGSSDADGVYEADLIVIDLGWTPQSRAIPVALAWLAASPSHQHPPRILTLVKPQYEHAHAKAPDPTPGREGGPDRSPAPSPPKRGRTSRRRGGAAEQRGGVLTPEESQHRFESVLASLPGLGVIPLASLVSPVPGGGRRRKKPGNTEYLVLLGPAANTDASR